LGFFGNSFSHRIFELLILFLESEKNKFEKMHGFKSKKWIYLLFFKGVHGEILQVGPWGLYVFVVPSFINFLVLFLIIVCKKQNIDL